jgi:hypothetical protein
VVNVASPVAGSIVPTPNALVLLATKYTVPAGVPALELTALTWAVNVTGWPATANVLELAIVVVVAEEVTTDKVPGTSVMV